MSKIIPYDQKVDIHLDSLQTFIACYEALKDEIREQYHDLHREQYEGISIYLDNLEFKRRVKEQIDAIKCRQLTIMETQAAVNKALLDLVEEMMADAYPRARRK
jgi:hypothetical protein